MSPVTDAPTGKIFPGKFVWHDLLTPDMAAAKDFYGSLFGWSFEQQGTYTVIRHEGRRLGGILELKPRDDKPAEAYWLASMSVVDVDKASKSVRDHGGAVLRGPLDMQQRGRGALISDPQGAQLVLLRAKNGDPLDAREPAEGEWLWNEIWSNQPQLTRDFYTLLGEYDSSLEQGAYTVLQQGSKWRAGIRHLYEKDFQVRWVPTVRVGDPQLISDRVEFLGGTVWVRPGEPPSDGSSALISDNTGALLMIQRWPDSATAEGQ